jgi:iron-sulfur cluster assembly protein
LQYFSKRLNFEHSFKSSIKIPKAMSEILEKTVAAPVQLTSGAVKQLKLIMQQQGIPSDYGLRIGVKGGGCSGFSYILGFDEKKSNDDEFSIEGMRVLMQKSHGIYLLGMEIDFVEGLNNRGFSFSNPNAKSTCGCGTSFSA